jgi:hypothetical protein
VARFVGLAGDVEARPGDHHRDDRGAAHVGMGQAGDALGTGAVEERDPEADEPVREPSDLCDAARTREVVAVAHEQVDRQGLDADPRGADRGEVGAREQVGLEVDRQIAPARVAGREHEQQSRQREPPHGARW